MEEELKLAKLENQLKEEKAKRLKLDLEIKRMSDLIQYDNTPITVEDESQE